MLECSVLFWFARLRERGVDVAEDVGDCSAYRADESDGSQGQQTGEQRILHEVLTVLAAD